MSNSIQRLLSLVMALVLVFSLMPFQAWAEEIESHNQESELMAVTELNTASNSIDSYVSEPNNSDIITEKSIEESETLSAEISASTAEKVLESSASEAGKLPLVREEISTYIAHYDLSVDMTDEQLAEVYFSIDETEPLVHTWNEEILGMAESLSNAEQEVLAADQNTDLFVRFSNVIDRIVSPAVTATTNLLSGGVTITNNSGTVGTTTDNSYVVSAGGGWVGRQTVTLTITNKSGTKATLSFHYILSGKYGSFTIAGSTPTSLDNDYSVTLDSDSSISIVVAGSGSLGAGNATLTLGNVQLVSATAKKKVTVYYDTGAVTVGGNEVTTGVATEIEGTNTELKLTEKAENFVAWVDYTTNKIISTTNPYTLELTGDIAVKAVITSEACFKSSADILYENLNSAIEAKISPIILVNNGTLPAGDYTIPAGVNLLIPYKADDAGMFVNPTANNGYLNETSSTISVFRTMTMAEGANITVNGCMNVNAQQYVSSNPNTNKVANSYGCIKMSSKSSITIANGGTLYCYGYIWGDGTVEAASGAKVFERMEVRDWRGGNVTTAWKDKYDCFVISQYYAQNIEAKYIINSGARSYVTIGIKASVTTQVSNPIFVGISGDNALFNLTSGKIIRTYDGKNDRMTYDVSGDLILNNLSITIQSFTSIDSKDYIFPVNNALTLNINSGNFTMKYPVKMLPGSQVNIAKDATATIESTGALYIYDAADIKGTTSDGVSKIYYYNGIQGANYSPTRSSVGGKRPGSYASAQLVVNGTLTANGPIYTSEQAGTDVNKVVKGTGTIHNNYASYSESVAIDELWQDSWSTTYGTLSVKCVPVVGHLAGINADSTSYTSIPTGTYFGLSNNYWYQWKVNTTGVDASGDPVEIDPVSITGGTDGYIVNGGTFTVTVPVGYALTGVSTSSGTLKENSGTYTLDGVTKDVTITVMLQCTHTNTTVQNVVDATCDKAGYSGDTVCSDCGETIQIGTTISAAGHTWAGGICSACGELSSFAVAQVQMVNSLTMQFGYPKKYLSDPTGFYVLIERTSAKDQTKTTQKITSDLWNADSDYYIINFNGLAAKEMCDTLTLTMYNANNEPVSKPWIDSMRDYAMRVLNKATEQTQKTLAVDFLNYGAEAQKQFDYCKTDLANAKLTEEQKKFASDTPTFESKLDGGDKRVGSNLILENNILFVVAFQGLNRDMSATVTFQHHNGQDVAVEVPGSEFGLSGNVYYVPIDEIVVADARQPITITVKNADGSVYTTCQDSIEDYLARYTSTISDINTAVMKFADSAYAYLHRNDNT